MPNNQKLVDVTASLAVFNLTVKNFHWNVEGKGFFTIHSKLDELYASVDGHIDELAERVRQLNEFVPADFASFSKRSFVSGHENPIKDAEEGISKILEDMKAIINALTDLSVEYEDDPVTQDMLNEMSAAFQKEYWMYSAWKGN
jgi:starvation-inducible DNA-binding protein